MGWNGTMALPGGSLELTFPHLCRWVSARRASVLLHVQRPTTCAMATARVSIHWRPDIDVESCI